MSHAFFNESTSQLVAWITTTEHNQWLLKRWDNGDRKIATPEGVPATEEYINEVRSSLEVLSPMVDDWKDEMYRRWQQGFRQ